MKHISRIDIRHSDGSLHTSIPLSDEYGADLIELVAADGERQALVVMVYPDNRPVSFEVGGEQVWAEPGFEAGD